MYVVFKINMFYIVYGRWKNKQDESIFWGFVGVFLVKGEGAFNVNIVIFNIFHEVLDRTLSFLKKIPGRFVSASVCTAFVAEVSNASDRVEVRLNSIRVADVIINGQTQDFSDVTWLRYRGRYTQE